MYLDVLTGVGEELAATESIELEKKLSMVDGTSAALRMPRKSK